MKNSKRNTAILTAAILVSLMATSIVFAGAYTFNPNVQQGTLYNSASWVTTQGSDAAYQKAKYGDLLQYEWTDPMGNGGERTGSYSGPAPDKGTVLWESIDHPSITSVLINNVAAPVSGAVISSMSGGVMGIDGQIFTSATIKLSNGTSRNALISFKPFTGDVNWCAITGLGITAGVSIGTQGPYKVDDKHICAIGGGLSMWKTDGTFLWRDSSITPSGGYFTCIVEQDPDHGVVSMCFGPTSVTTAATRASSECGWDLSNPEVDKGTGGRRVWYHVMDEAGTQQMCYGDGLVFMGSQSSYKTFAINATTGEKVWETATPGYVVYAGVYAEGRYITNCASMTVICYNGTTGEILWQDYSGLANRAFNVYGARYYDGRVYMHDLGAGISGATKCFDIHTGEKLWASLTTQYIGYYWNVIGDGKIYGVQSDGSYTTGRESQPEAYACWDAYTGEKLWTFGKGQDGPSNICPSLVYGCLYFTFEGKLTCISTALEPVPWSMWRGNVENPGVTKSQGPTNLVDGPAWTFTTGGAVESSPVIANGKLYVGSHDLNLYCLDAYTGKLYWKTPIGANTIMTGFFSTPAVVGNKVIVGPDDGNFYCFDANTGEQLWKYNTGSYIPVTSVGQFNLRPSPIIYNNRIYCGSIHSNKTYCLTLDGTLVWAFETGGPIVSSVAIENNIVYQCTWGNSNPGWNDTNNVYMLNADTGAKIRNFEITVNNFPRLDRDWQGFAEIYGGAFGSSVIGKTPVVVGDKLYYGVDHANMQVFNTTTGKLIWRAEQPRVLGENSIGSCLYVPDTYGGKIYTQAGPTMACVNASLIPNVKDEYRYRNFANSSSAPLNPTFGETVIVGLEPTGIDRARSGQQTAIKPNVTNLWSSWGGWEIWASPIYSGFEGQVANGSSVIYAGSDSYGMFMWNASNGAALSWFTTGGNVHSSAAIYDNRLYFGSGDNKVYCFADHPVEPMAISITLDKNSVNLNNTESVTATVALSGINTRSYDLNSNPITMFPPFPNASIIVTFTDPNGVDTNMTATTDANGMASATFTPNVKGTWKVIAWYLGEDRPTFSYGYCWSDQPTIEAAQTITIPLIPPPATTDYTPYYYAAIVVVAIVIVAAAALMLLRRRKK